MFPTLTVVSIVCTFVVSSIQLRDPSLLNIQNNETEYCNFRCNSLEPVFKSLIRKEISWIGNMKSHLDHLDFHMDILKRDYEDISNVTMELKFLDKRSYLGNPMSLFALLKRSAKDWPKIAHLMLSLPGGLSTMSLYNSSLAKLYHGYKLYLPNIEDLSTGYRGLSRLQTVYDLATDSLAEQRVTSHQSLFSARDFLGFANYFCDQALFKTCQEWLAKVQEKINESPLFDISEEDFLGFSFISSCLNGNQTISSIIFKDLLDRKTTFSALSQVRESLKDIFYHGCEQTRKVIDDYRKKTMRVLKPQSTEYENARFIAWANVQEQDPSLLEMCKYQAVYNVTARLLKCRYVHYNNPYLRIRPFKMEEFHIDPPVLMFHDVIFDNEISEMVNHSRKILAKATVHNEDGSDTVDMNYRTNEQGWVWDSDLPFARILSKRVALMTGWDLRRAEPHQVACYGPGGEFVPHIDALDEEYTALAPGYADYSVAMFYINEVAAGGHTIFPALNVSLVPQKGSAVVWFNRRPDGSPDPHSIHAGCPVLEGYKWVINKWLHTDAPQDFPKCTNKKNASFRYFYL